MQTVSEIMTDEVLYLMPHNSAAEAARKMKQLNVGIIPICDDSQRLLGVVTDRDIVLRVVAEGRDPEEARLEQIGTMDPVAGQREWAISDAMALMSEYQIRRLPVVENGRLVGIVSLGDFAVQTEVGAGEALEEISKPAMPRKAGINEGDETA